MTYGRLSAGVIRLVPDTVLYDGRFFSNPPHDFLVENNWKPVVFVLQPDAEHSVMNWFEETNAIVQVWSTPSSSSVQELEPAGDQEQELEPNESTG